jgi:uncharacterized protein DUF4190
MADDPTPPPLPSQPTPAPTAIARRIEPLAIVSLVLAILSWFVCLLFGSIPAIICGHLSRSKIRKSNGALRGMEIALAGLIIGYLEIPFGVLGGVMLVDMIRSDRERLHDLAIKREEIASDDGKLRVTASGFWMKATDLNKRASLQAAYKNKELYVIVISEPKSTVPDVTLQQHHQTTRDHMLKEMSNSSSTATVPVAIDGHPGLQDEISGTEKGAILTFLHTTVDDGDAFDQILAWTLKSRWLKHNSELREVTNSFHSEK